MEPFENSKSIFNFFLFWLLMICFAFMLLFAFNVFGETTENKKNAVFSESPFCMQNQIKNCTIKENSLKKNILEKSYFIDWLMYGWK